MSVIWITIRRYSRCFDLSPGTFKYPIANERVGLSIIRNPIRVAPAQSNLKPVDLKEQGSIQVETLPLVGLKRRRNE
jgi:hypothetical protein